MFKRPRLSTPFTLVNAPYALAVLFLCSACGSPETSVLDDPEETVSQETPVQPVSLPAVWNTSALPAPLTSVGLAGAWGSRIAVTYESGALQFFDFEGERLTEPAELNVRRIADGHFVDLSGASLTLFPGIQDNGDLRLYIHAGDLDAPLPFDFDVRPDGATLGLCSAAMLPGQVGLIRLAYWTETTPNRLHLGRVIESGDTLAFQADDIMTSDRPITACMIGPEGARTFSAPIRAVSRLERNGRQFVLALDTSGNLQEISERGTRRSITIRDGLSVDMPALPVGLAGTGDARTGGYPGGLIVMIGDVGPGEARAILIDPSPLTLSAMPAGRH